MPAEMKFRGSVFADEAPLRGVTLARRASALFLDVDGTLLDIAPTPEAVAVPRGLVRDLQRLAAKLGGALAILSGRSIAEIDRLFFPLQVPAAGQHGAELRPIAAAGAADFDSATPLVPQAWQARLAVLAQQHEGVLIEPKGHSIAVHFRNAPEAESSVEATMRRLAESDPRFVVQLGHCVAELKPRGASKGAALLALMRRPVFRTRTPVVIGDDLTDEDAFLAAGLLGGRGLHVGPRRDPRAPGFSAPDDVRRWIGAWARAL